MGLLEVLSSGRSAQPGTLTEGTFPQAGGGCCRAAERRSGGGPHWLDGGGLAPEGIAWCLDGRGSGSGAAARWLVGVGGVALCRVVAAVPFLGLQKIQCVINVYSNTISY